MTALAIAAAAVVIALVLAAWLGRARRSWTARRRAARAGRGEEGAARLLARHGFRVVERGARTWFTVIVDGEPFDTELIADYVVEHGGERLLAEVKTGAVAPRLTTAATRRQLLEYRVAFAVDGVLLVCPERGTIQRVEFALRRPENLPSARPASTLGP